jgi:hypothetical protein
MKTLKIENVKINNKGKNFHSSCYEGLNSEIERLNNYIEKKGAISPRQQPVLDILNYAMENEVTIQQLDAALLFCQDDFKKAMGFFSR